MNTFQALERSMPLLENMPETVLDELLEMLIRNCEQLRGYLLTRNGKVVGEYYRPPYGREDKVWVYSVSKAFTATAVGIACQEGLLKLEDRAADFFQDRLPKEPGEYLRAMRVQDLLCMSTGQAVDAGEAMLAAEDGDWIRAFLEIPVVYRPGTHFCYNSGATYILSAIVKAATKEGLVEYLKPRLFRPLGFDQILWDKSPEGIEAGGWGLKARLEDLAKLGELYRQRGIYRGQRILEEEWVERATGACIDNSQNDTVNIDWKQGYGFQMWRGRHNTFRADGAVGQYCIVMPDQNAVLTVLSETVDMQKVLDGVWDVLLPALNSSLHSEMEKEISSKRYLLRANELEFSSVRFCFAQDELTCLLSGKDEEYSLCALAGRWREGTTILPIGHSSLVPYFSLRGRPQVVSAHYEWTAVNVLEINLVWRESPHRERLICEFQGESVTITCPPNLSAANIGRKAFHVVGRVRSDDKA